MRSLILAALLSLTSASCAAPSSRSEPAATSTTKSLPDRDPQLAKKLVSEGALLLDVRSQAEWDKGHLDGATLIPVDEVDKRLGEVDAATNGNKDQPIVIYCGSGARAARAKKQLEAAGHTQVTNMGGIADWPAD